MLVDGSSTGGTSLRRSFATISLAVRTVESKRALFDHATGTLVMDAAGLERTLRRRFTAIPSILLADRRVVD